MLEKGHNGDNGDITSHPNKGLTNGSNGSLEIRHKCAKCATKRLIKGSLEEGRRVKRSTAVNFEQYAVLHEMSPISQTPSDKLIVSDEQLKNTNGW